MSSLKGFVRRNLNPITHEVLRRNRVTETFIKEVIKQAKFLYFDNGRKRPEYRHLSIFKIHSLCRKRILDTIKEPTIQYAFTWGITIQGHNFWDNIDDQIILEADNLR